MLERGGCFSVTGFLVLVSGGQRLSSVVGMCDDLEMIGLSAAASEARPCLRLALYLASRRSRVSTVSEVRRRLSLSQLIGSHGRRRFLKRDAGCLSPYALKDP